MALGPDNFNLTISLDSIFCFQGDDIDDVFDEESNRCHPVTNGVPGSQERGGVPTSTE